MATKPNPDETITNTILEAMANGVVPWHRPWTATDMPRSMSTGRNYRGINTVMLELATMVNEYENSFWGTYKQIANHGGQVRKGERGTQVVFWKIFEKLSDQLGPEGEPVIDKIPRIRLYTVFNAEQADWNDGMPTKFEPTTVETEIAGWSAKFKDDPKVLVTAAGLAQRAADFVQGITPADWAHTNTEEPATV